MNTKDEALSTERALKLALEALEFYDQQGIGRIPGDKAITAIREALNAPLAHAPEVREQPIQQQDIPDLIAGALGVSRGTAYDMMRDALAQQQEPVAWVVEDQNGERLEWAEVAHIGWGWKKLPLYTSPPQDALVSALYSKIDFLRGKIELLESGLVQAKRTWRGLTDEDVQELRETFGIDRRVTSAIEAKLREKNA